MKIETNKYRLDIVATNAQEKMVNAVIAEILFGEVAETSTEPRVSPALAEAVRKPEIKPAAIGGTPAYDRIGNKGLLLIRCEECGKVAIINAKEPMTDIECRECGHRTHLDDLAVIEATCTCGMTWHYLTNFTSATVAVWCKACDEKIVATWDKELRKYVN